MIKILNSKVKKFDIILDNLLSKRKSKIRLNSTSVIKILNDVKKNGDKAILKYEKKFSNNNKIKTNKLKIKKSIKSLDLKIKKAIDLSYKRIKNFFSNIRLFLFIVF